MPLAAAGAEVAPAPPAIALIGATLIDGTGAPPVTGAVVVVRDGRIDCAGPAASCPVPAGSRRIELAGRWLTPGLVDAHVHFSQTGWADGRPDSLDVRTRYPYAEVVADLASRPQRFYRSWLCAGVTAVFDVGGYPWTWTLRGEGLEQGAKPHVAAAGPLLTTWDFWLNLPAERQFIYLPDEASAVEAVAYLDARRADAVKIWFIPDEGREPAEMAAVVRAAGREAARYGLPLIVHATGLREAKIAVEAGAHLLVHSVWDRPVDGELIRLLRERGTVYCPTLTVGRGYLRMYRAAVEGEAPEVDDPNGCVDAEMLRRVAETAAIEAPGLDDRWLSRRTQATAERERIAAENLAALSTAGVPIAMGTDAGNPLTLHGPAVYAEMEAMQAAGLSPLEVLVAATQGGARAMSREAEIGTVEKGKIADLLVLGADPSADISNLRRVVQVMRGGMMIPVTELAFGPQP